MTPEEKIQHVKDEIDAQTLISPKGPIWFIPRSVSHAENEEWTLITRSEIKQIIFKLQEERYIKNVQISEDGKGVWLEKVKKRTSEKKQEKTRSNLYSRIKNTDQLLQERELFDKAIKIIGDIEPHHSYKKSTSEENDDLIQLLMDLNLIDYDWSKIAKQTHRVIGNRIIEFSFDADPIIALKERVSGKSGRVNKEALQYISEDIYERFNLDQIMKMLVDVGVPESMFIQDETWRTIFYPLSYYSTSKNEEENNTLLKILEKVLHPLSFGGDEDKAKHTQDQYSRYFKFDNLKIKDNHVYYSSENNDFIDDWLDQIQNLKNKTEVIKNFNLFNFNDLKINKKIYLLKVLYSYYEAIITTYYSNGLFFLSAGIDDLNDYFKILRKTIITIVDNEPSFNDIKQSKAYETAIQMVNSLYSSSEFLDVLWDDSILPSIIYLREEISDKDLFENKAEIHKVTYGVMFFFSAIETEIENLKKQLGHANKKFNGEPENPSSKEREGQVTHFKHDHIHRFENSIQEKDITIRYPENQEDIVVPPKVYLKDRKIFFNDESCTLQVDDKTVSLPPYMNEHFFCRSMFQRKKAEPVDWSIIYQEMAGKSEPDNQANNKRMVKDTMYAVNNRIKKTLGTDDALFIWREKTITRQY